LFPSSPRRQTDCSHAVFEIKESYAEANIFENPVWLRLTDVELIVEIADRSTCLLRRARVFFLCPCFIIDTANQYHKYDLAPVVAAENAKSPLMKGARTLSLLRKP
jgi:hypothetical protein